MHTNSAVAIDVRRRRFTRYGDAPVLHRLATLTLVAAACLAAPVVAREAQPEPLRVLSSNGLRAVLLAVLPEFERAHGRSVHVEFAPAAVLGGRIGAGEAFDVAILTPAGIDAAIASGHVFAGSRKELAQSPVGLAMQAGAPRPQMATMPELVQTLRNARSIGYAAQGASAKPFEALIERLGLSDVRPRLEALSTGNDVGDAVAKREVQYAVLPVSEIITVEGLALAGVFPSEVQFPLVLVGGVSATARDRRAAEELLRDLTDVRHAPIFSRLGMEQVAEKGERWVTTWTAPAHGVYPYGTPSAQPELRFAFPNPSAGAADQTFRLIVRSGIWGSTIRLRFSNAFGDRPLVLNDVFAGLQLSAGHLVPATNRVVMFRGKAGVSIPPGEVAWSDPVNLDFVARMGADHLTGRKLAVSFHVVGKSGPMTWHSKALQTSYVTAPGSGMRSRDDSESAFTYTTASWFFLDKVDVMAPSDTAVVVCLGDSITDGTGSTMNGDDRWPDVLAARVRDRFGSRVVVLNAGVGSNRVLGPADYQQTPFRGGPGALDRLERHVLSLSSVQTVIWLEGINDFGAAGASVEAVTAGYRTGIDRMRVKGIRVIGATLPSALNAANGTHGTPEVDVKRRAANEFVRTSGAFDAVVDFDVATLDSATGELKPEMQPNSLGGAGDKLHPNRAGYAAMANSVDLAMLAPRGESRTRPPR